MEDLAERIVAELEPSEGWFKDYTRDMLEDAALTLLLDDVDEETVEETLNQVINAIRGEYGE